MTNQPVVPVSRSLTGKQSNTTPGDRHAAAGAKRGSNRRNAVGDRNPKNRKAGPG